MRSKKTLINIASVWGGQAMIIVVNMIARKVFLQSLGSDYLGLNSLFTNIVGLLAVAELGFGSAIDYSLYKPLAEDDKESIKSLMRLYKKIYCTIGCIILFGGLLLVPWIPSLASGTEEIENVRFIFMMFVFNTAVSYFFSYYTALITADQKKYVYNIVHYVFQFLMYGMQIVILLNSKNYYAYLLCQMAATVFENLIMTVIAKRKYPYLQQKNVKPISADNLFSINKNVKALILNKIGMSLVTSTDNILISKLTNLSVVGIYGNYSTIVTAVRNAFWLGITSFTASVGNQLVKGTKKECIEIFYAVQLLGNWLYGWGTICLFVLLTPFVRLWYGEYILATTIVLMICVNLYLSGQRTVLQSYISAAGMYHSIRYRAITEGILNVILSVILGKYFGLSGIFAGTLISGFLCGWIPETKVITDELFDINEAEYIKIQIKNVISVFAAGAVNVLVSGMNSNQGIVGFIVKIIICIFVPNVIIILFNCKNPAFHTCIRKVAGVFNRRKRN